MKQKDLINILKRQGFYLKRHGANHDVYGNDVLNIAIPRHKEIGERLAHKILKEAGIE